MATDRAERRTQVGLIATFIPTTPPPVKMFSKTPFSRPERKEISTKTRNLETV